MKLTKEEIQHIAELARLELTEEEMETYGGQLSAIFGYIDQLKEVDTTTVEPTAQVTGLKNVMRDDEARNWDEAEKQAALAQAPELADRQVKVRRVL